MGLTTFQELNRKEILDKAKGVKHFVINVEKTHKDEIELSNGQKLYLDPKFNEVANRVHYGYVICAPKKLEHQFPKGTKVWFYHMATVMKKPKMGVNGKQVQSEGQFIEKGIYYLGWSDHIDAGVENQVIAYEDKNGDIKAFQWWVLVKPKDSTHKIKSNILDVSFVNSQVIQNVGEVAFISDKCSKYWNVSVGDTVSYKDSQRYEIEINGEIYYRIRPQAILYAEKN